MKDYQTMTMTRRIGCGNIYCIFLEDEDAFHKLFIKGDSARSTPCGESWMNALGSILTYALRRSVWEGNTQKGIIKHLLHHRCNHPIKDWKTREELPSCSHAIGSMVLEYLKGRDYVRIEQEKEEGITVTQT